MAGSPVVVGKKAKANQKDVPSSAMNMWLWIVTAVFVSISVIWIVDHMFAAKKIDLIADGVVEHRQAILRLTETLSGYSKVLEMQESRLAILEAIIIAKGGAVPDRYTQMQPGVRKSK
jgi:hypothetical protein